MTTMPRPVPPFDELPAEVPFVGPEAIERASGGVFAARIGANENNFGPSSSVVQTMQNAAPDMWMHGDPDNHDLTQALAAHYDLPAERLKVGEGIDGLLGLFCRLHLDADRSVLCSKGAYPTFLYHVAASGAQLHTVPYKDDANDLKQLAETARQQKPALLYLNNPDNPTGSHYSAEAIIDFLDAVPQETLVLLDEAYIEFAPEGTAPEIGFERANLVRLRTFSKAYGLAGLRVGYAIGPSGVLADLEKVRNHFGVTRMGQIGARAALSDRSHLELVLGRIQAAKTKLISIAERHGLTALPSATNFVAIDCGSAERSRKLLDLLAERSVFVRRPGVAGLDRLIRVTAGRAADMDLFASAFAEAWEIAQGEAR